MRGRGGMSGEGGRRAPRKRGGFKKHSCDASDPREVSRRERRPAGEGRARGARLEGRTEASDHEGAIPPSSASLPNTVKDARRANAEVPHSAGRREVPRGERRRRRRGAGGDGDGGDGDGACRPSLFGGMRDRATRRATRATRRRGALSCQEESFWNYLYGFRESLEFGSRRRPRVRPAAVTEATTARRPASDLVRPARFATRAPRVDAARLAALDSGTLLRHARAPRDAYPSRGARAPPAKTCVGSNHRGRSMPLPTASPAGAASHAATASGDAEAPVAPAAPPGDAHRRARSRTLARDGFAGRRRPAARRRGEAERAEDARDARARMTRASSPPRPRKPPRRTTLASRRPPPRCPRLVRRATRFRSLLGVSPEASKTYAPGDGGASPATFDENRLRLARAPPKPPSTDATDPRATTCASTTSTSGATGGRGRTSFAQRRRRGRAREQTAEAASFGRRRRRRTARESLERRLARRDD